MRSCMKAQNKENEEEVKRSSVSSLYFDIFYVDLDSTAENSTGVLSSSFGTNFLWICRLFRVTYSFRSNDIWTWTHEVMHHICFRFGLRRTATALKPAQLSVNRKNVKNKFYWIYSAISRESDSAGWVRDSSSELNYIWQRTARNLCAGVTMESSHEIGYLIQKVLDIFPLFARKASDFMFMAQSDYSRFQVWVALLINEISCRALSGWISWSLKVS